MAEVIRMPLLSDTMKEGVILKWHKKVGDQIKSDDVIAEVETDKATMDVIPYVEGILLHIQTKEGEAAPVNGMIAIIGKKGENIDELIKKESAGGKTSAAPVKAEHAPAPQTSASKNAKPNPSDAQAVLMPLMSDTMTEGTIANWLKKVGDKVASDEAIAEVETDKATMDLIPYMEGTLLHINVAAGESAKVNSVVAIIGKPGTDFSALLEENTVSSGSKANVPAAAAAPVSAEVPHESPSSSDEGDGRLRVSPLARRMAKEKGIDLHQVSGSGEGGRIVKRDIDNFVPKAAAVSFTGIAAAPSGVESYTDIPLSQMRKTVARRLSESKFSAPHFYLRMNIKMDEAVKARKAMNEVSPVKISFNDLVIKACAMALRKHPDVNSSYMGDFIRQNHHISVGTAVAIPEGLIVPVIKFTDTKSLSQIAAEAKELIEKARNRKLQPEEFTGNTFTISNLGMMDIDEFTAIINPPDSCILAVGKITPEPVVENDQVVIRQIMKITLSCDHRAVDGAKGAAFLQTLKSYLENPVTMLV